MSILVVEDDPLSRQLMGLLLRGSGYDDVATAQSVAEAIEYLDRETGGCDLVLLDLNLPDGNGFTILRRMKGAPAQRDIPVIVVTGSENDSDLVAAFDAGALDFLTKPVSQRELLARVRAALRLKEETRRRRESESDLVRAAAELAQASRQLEDLSSEDPLTGMANRRQFDRVLDQEWHRALRHGAPLGLILIEVDAFKAYRETYGEAVGNACLRKIAAALRGAPRRAGDLIARYSATEFAAILPSAGGEAALEAAETLLAAVQGLRIAHAASPAGDVVTLSIGVAAVVPEPAVELEALVMAADTALYKAKRGGRNRVCARGVNATPALATFHQ